MTYRRYPLSMAHPNYRPAVISGVRRNPDGSFTNDAPGKPAQFPPVYVNNEDQEQEYAAKGYLPQGVSDPDAYHRAKAGANAPEQFAFVEYPKFLYKKGSDGALISQLVHSEKQEIALGKGWHSTPACSDAEDEIDEPERRRGRPRKIVDPVVTE